MNEKINRAEPTLPDSAALIRSLMSTVCPFCARSKRPKDTMCPNDYARLSVTQRRAMYRRIGDGYEAALIDAMRTLGVPAMRLPPIDGETAPCPRCGYPHPTLGRRT